MASRGAYRDLSARARAAVNEIIREGCAYGFGQKIAREIEQASGIPYQVEHIRYEGAWLDMDGDALARWKQETERDLRVCRLCEAEGKRQTHNTNSAFAQHGWKTHGRRDWRNFIIYEER